MMNALESYKNNQQDDIQKTYFGHATFNIFMACRYFSPVTQPNSQNDHPRIVALTCVSKVFEFTKQKMPITSSLR